MNNYNYIVRRKWFTLFGQKFYIFDHNGVLVGFCKQKAFKLKEDIRVYSDWNMSRELVTILARNIIDFSASYDVFDPATGQLLGSWKRKGFASMLRDTWAVFDPNGNQIAELHEDKMFLAFFRRFICDVIPQSFKLSSSSGEQAVYTQGFNPFIFRLKVSLDPGCTLHPYLVLAGAVLLAAIEKRQSE